MIEELNNAARAKWAREAVEAYARETRHSPSEQVIDVTTRPDEWPGREHAEEVISDLLGDLHHLCDELGLDWEAQLARGAMHHREEVAEERMADELEAKDPTMPATMEAIKDLITPDPWGQAGGR